MMSNADIQNGKAALQQADLMDYGSLYGMGSYFGEDYTAEYLVRLATLTEDNIAATGYGQPFSALNPERRAAVQAAMRQALRGIVLPRGY
jgi:nitric oxide reductase subunit B